MDVRDAPIWEDCPYRGDVPSDIEIRLMPADSARVGVPEEMFILWSPAHQVHAAVIGRPIPAPDVVERQIRPMVDFIKQAIAQKGEIDAPR